MDVKYIYTNHLLERMEERFGFKWDWTNKREAWKQIDEIMEGSKEDKSYLNNAKYMMNLQDLHGYDSKYEFRSNMEHDIVFVMIVERGNRIVKTCYRLSKSSFLSRKGFSNKGKKSQKRYTPRSRKYREPFNEIEAMQEHLMNFEDDSNFESH